MEEIWKDIPGYENKYQASNTGKIRSLNYNKTGEIKELNPTKLKEGYLMTQLYNNGIKNRMLVHRIIALTFLSNPLNLPCVNHKDENKENNNVNNLEWCTYEYNNNYGSHPTKLSNAIKGKKLSDETKEKCRIANLGRKHTEEAKKKMIISRTGKHHSEETKRKISESNKGRIPWNKGKHLSEESNKGRIPWNKGKHLSEELKKKMSEARKRYLQNKNQDPSSCVGS